MAEALGEKMVEALRAGTAKAHGPTPATCWFAWPAQCHGQRVTDLWPLLIHTLCSLSNSLSWSPKRISPSRMLLWISRLWVQNSTKSALRDLSCYLL